VTTGVRELSGADNFRDVALSAGIRPGRLFRSGELSRLDDDGRDALQRLGITDVADFRSRREVARRGPGRTPDGVDVHLLPIPDLTAQPGEPDGQSPHEHAFKRLMRMRPGDEPIADSATRYMVDVYRGLPTYNGAQRAVRRLVMLLTAGRPVLAHCFAGKDRTGFIVAVVLEAIGIDRYATLSDYLRSNDAAPQLRARILEMIRQRSGSDVTPEALAYTEARLSDEVLGVHEEYLAAAWSTIDETYGSLDGYLHDAGITGLDLDRLRGELLG
jgi:protein-tyrosine phosphatase